MVGPGVQEIRVRDESGAYRVLYVAQFYVLNLFVKRSQKTAIGVLQLATARYGDLLKWRKEQDL
jgi:phage-related protein